MLYTMMIHVSILMNAVYVMVLERSMIVDVQAYRYQHQVKLITHFIKHTVVVEHKMDIQIMLLMK